MYALYKGINELMEVQDKYRSIAKMEIYPEYVLLNDYGFIKMIGYCSTPTTSPGHQPIRVALKTVSTLEHCFPSISRTNIKFAVPFIWGESWYP